MDKNAFEKFSSNYKRECERNSMLSHLWKDLIKEQMYGGTEAWLSSFRCIAKE